MKRKPLRRATRIGYRVDMEEDAAEIARNTLEGLCHEWQL